MQPEVTTRTATSADADKAVAVLRASISQLCHADHNGDAAALTDWLANKTPQRFVAWLARRDRHTIVAERDGTLCGVGMLGTDGGVYICYVRPGYERRGVGRALMNALEAQAKTWRLERLHLDSTRTAQQFYEAMGFSRSGEPNPRFGVTGMPYEKRLLPSD
ncbi:MAG: GNAT family N-acetyltransferase [Nannocystales bacterium]